MATLHLVNKTAALADCLAVAAREDTVLLLEDGVYGAVPPGPAAAARLLALDPDVRARGLLSRLAPGVGLISDAEFVALVEHHQPVVTWR